ncbi:MAG: CPBP family intramembrane glutamic endopeptidase [Myxococcota bacterium]|nr:CPBP family intramembrane glutamic endopeptidase [Myxococcota bacterium]
MSQAPYRGPEAPPPPPPAGEEGAAVPSPLAALALTASAWLVARLALELVAAGGGIALGLAVGLTLGLGALGTVAARAVPPPADRRLGLAAPEPRSMGWLLLLLPLPLVLSELDNLVALGLGRPEPAAETAEADGLDAVEWGLLLVGLRPVLEEFFFRGVLLQGLVSALGRTRGVLVDAALFAVLRGSFFGSVFAAASMGGQAFVLGLLLAGLRLASGSLVPGIGLQAAVAAIGLTVASWGAAPRIPGFNAPGAHTPPEVLAPALLAVAAGAAPLPPIPREPPSEGD